MTSTPAWSSACTTARTWPSVNWCAMAWLPSRSVESVSRTSAIPALLSFRELGPVETSLLSLGQQHADPGGGRGHDVQVPRPRRQVVAAAGDLEQDADASAA